MTIKIQHENSTDAILYVCNIIGQLLDTKRIPANTNVQYNIGEKAAGIYFLNFKMDGEIMTRKVSVF